MTTPTASRRRPSSRSIRDAFGVVGLGAAVMLIAGCGGSSSPGVAHLGSDVAATSASAEGGGAPESKASAQAKLVAYARCMRANGVPAFPEPVEGGIELQSHNGSGVDPESAQFKSADAKCHKLMPEGGKPSPQQQKQAEERALQVSACMRSHGVPNFPEPEFSGNSVRMRVKAGAGGIDPRSPQFQAAQKACAQYFGPPGSKGGPAVAFGPPGAGKAPSPGGGSNSESSQRATP